jgi:putative flippase GtrA
LPVVVVSDFTKGFINFSLHKKYTFKDETKTFSMRNIKSFIRYYFINIVGAIIVFVLIIFFVEFIHLSAFWGKFIADLIINFSRFSSHKKVVFERDGYKLGE